MKIYPKAAISILGAAETTLLSLTSAYTSFINGGKKTDAKLISRIQDRIEKQSSSTIK